MLFFLLAAVLLLSAGLLWYNEAAGKPAPGGKSGEENVRTAEISPETTEALAAAVEALREVMAHPLSGGPGFITLRFPPLEDAAYVTAQYPNIREALYRRIVRRELSGEVLALEGVPERLLEMSPDFETESGGVVALTVKVRGVGGDVAVAMSNLRERKAVLETLAADLSTRFPDLSVRPAGSELLLTRST